MTAAAATVDEIMSLYDRWAGDPYDEELTQLAHALQTAALASAAGAAEPLIAAALLHDTGHLLALAAGGGRPPPTGTTSDDRHEQTGARYLAARLPPAVTAPIALHVAAKRYRCAVDPEYLSYLSAGSVRSLERQGGPMADAERKAFEAHHAFDDAVRMREWDDRGKVDGLVVAPLDEYRSLLDRLARR